jgi:putative nucleotidyltransferase with HDIG domain
LAEVREAHRETLEAMVSSLELRERYTAGHSRRVRDYALLISRAMNIADKDFLQTLATGALLHDVGKMGIADRVLLKEDNLTDEEWALMHRHPELGTALIGEISFLQKVRSVVFAHHERYDGSGYPAGLSGEKIPLADRILAVADVFDALTTDRPYRSAHTYGEAVNLIGKERGVKFDPAVVDAFLGVPFQSLAEIAQANGVHLIGGNRP